MPKQKKDVGYCGALDLPNGRRRATMKECADSKQVRFYGIHALPIELIDQLRKQKPVSVKPKKKQVKKKAVKKPKK